MIAFFVGACVGLVVGGVVTFYVLKEIMRRSAL